MPTSRSSLAVALAVFSSTVYADVEKPEYEYLEKIPASCMDKTNLVFDVKEDDTTFDQTDIFADLISPLQAVKPNRVTSCFEDFIYLVSLQLIWEDESDPVEETAEFSTARIGPVDLNALSDNNLRYSCTSTKWDIDMPLHADFETQDGRITSITFMDENSEKVSLGEATSENVTQLAWDWPDNAFLGFYGSIDSENAFSNLGIVTYDWNCVRPGYAAWSAAQAELEEEEEEEEEEGEEVEEGEGDIEDGEDEEDDTVDDENKEDDQDDIDDEEDKEDDQGDVVDEEDKQDDQDDTVDEEDKEDDQDVIVDDQDTENDGDDTEDDDMENDENDMDQNDTDQNDTDQNDTDQNDTDQNDMEDNEGTDDDSDVVDDDEDDQVDTDVDSQDDQDVTGAGGEGTDSTAGQASANEVDDYGYDENKFPSSSEASDVTLAIALVIAFFSCLLLAILATVAKHTCMKQPIKKMEMVDDGEPTGSARPLNAD